MRVIAGFFTCLFMMSQIFTPLSVYAADRKYEGVDVSVWQGDIDFSKVKEAGKDIVYIRAGYGIAEDEKFRENAERAKEAELKTGFYFYVTALNVTEAQKQAKYFADLIKEYDYDCIPAVDFEQFSGLTKRQANDIAIAFIETLEQYTNTTPMFYSNSYRTASLWEDTLTRYPLWVANYGREEIPKTGIWQTWAGWQHSNKGEVLGITGKVDLDYFTDDVLVDRHGDACQNELPFTDVHPVEWYYSAVCNLYEGHLISGVSKTMFDPSGDARRDMAMAILYRLDGRPTIVNAANFIDVAEGKWYSNSTLWAKENKVAMGYKGELFYPENGIKREELVEFLYRYAELKGYDVALTKENCISKFQDANEVEKWAVDGLQWAVDRGILVGTTGATLAPKEIATRGQMVVMIDRFMTVYKA